MRNTKLSGAPLAPSRMRRNSKPPSRARALCFSNGTSSARMTFMALPRWLVAQILGEKTLVDGGIEIDRVGELAGQFHALDHRIEAGFADVTLRKIIEF